MLGEAHTLYKSKLDLSNVKPVITDPPPPIVEWKPPPPKYASLSPTLGLNEAVTPFIRDKLKTLAQRARTGADFHTCDGSEDVSERFIYPYKSLVPKYRDEKCEVHILNTMSTATKPFLEKHGILADIQNLEKIRPWLDAQVAYINNLSPDDLSTIQSYTQYGYELTNKFMQQTFYTESPVGRDLKKKVLSMVKVQTLRLLPTIMPSEYVDAQISNKVTVKDVLLGDTPKLYKIKRSGEYIKIDFWRRVIRAYVRDIDRIINCAPPLPRNLCVYRGVNQAYYQKGSMHGRFDNLGFVSTSLDPTSAGFYRDIRGCCVLRILLPIHTRALVVFPISHFPSESEILLPEGTQFHLINGQVTNFVQRESSKGKCRFDRIKVTDIRAGAVARPHRMSKSASK